MRPPPALPELLEELAKDDPELLDAVADVDRALVREALERTPLGRVDRVCDLLATLRTFRHAPP